MLAANVATTPARLSARRGSVVGNRCASLTAARVPVLTRAPRSRALIVQSSNDWPAPALVQGPPGLDRQVARHQGGGTLERERMEIMEKANKLANIDPNDPKSLEAIGSKVQCRVQFRIGYQTQVGEDLFIVGSHKKMGEWNQHHALPMQWSDGGNWFTDLELPAGGVVFYKYVVKQANGAYRWQEGANNLLVLPDEWDIPRDSMFVVDDNFSGLSRSSQNMLASKVISYEKEIVQLRLETVKAKEMTKASLKELLLTREELEEANSKLDHYERNVATVIASMQHQQDEANSGARYGENAR